MRVLVVEDNQQMRDMFVIKLKKRGVDEVVVAESVEQARHLFHKYGGRFDGIILDGCLVDNHTPDGIGLLREFRLEGFVGPIVAASSSDDLNLMMIEEGATTKVNEHNFRGQKESAPRILLDLLL
jgi:DNA-binding response OmpR family regulator